MTAHEAWHTYCQANPTKSGKQRPLIQRNAFLDGYAAHTQEHAKRARTEAIAGLLDLKGMGEAAEMVRNEFQD